MTGKDKLPHLTISNAKEVYTSGGQSITFENHSCPNCMSECHTTKRHVDGKTEVLSWICVECGADSWLWTTGHREATYTCSECDTRFNSWTVEYLCPSCKRNTDNQTNP